MIVCLIEARRNRFDLNQPHYERCLGRQHHQIIAVDRPWADGVSWLAVGEALRISSL